MVTHISPGSLSPAPDSDVPLRLVPETIRGPTTGTLSQQEQRRPRTRSRRRT